MSGQEILAALNAGQWVQAAAKDSPEIAEMLGKAADQCFKLNSLPPSRTAERTQILKSLLGSARGNFTFLSPFRCDFGFNIHIGENFIGNFNLSILDEAPVRIGDNVMIGPNCTIITITHALLPEQRADGVMKARPVTIGDNAWIAANVTILPGVEIGPGAVIGAGSVVTRSIPAGMLAAGNPCRPMRPITAADKA